jgi:hypothetical protein
MSARPGRILADVRLDLPARRTAGLRTAPELLHEVRRIESALRAAAPRPP